MPVPKQQPINLSSFHRGAELSDNMLSPSELLQRYQTNEGKQHSISDKAFRTGERYNGVPVYYDPVTGKRTVLRKDVELYSRSGNEQNIDDLRQNQSMLQRIEEQRRLQQALAEEQMMNQNTQDYQNAQYRHARDHTLETMQHNSEEMTKKYGIEWRNSSPYGMSVGNGEDSYKLLALTGLPAAAIIGGIEAYKDTRDYNRGYRTETRWNPELQHTEEYQVPISKGDYATNLAFDALPAATFGAGRLLSSAGRGLAAASEGAAATGLRAGSQAARWANAPMLSRSVQLPLRAMTTTGEVVNPAVNVVIPRWAGIAGAAAAGAATYPALRQASQQVSPLLMTLGYTSLHNGLEGLLPQTRSRTRDLMPVLDSTAIPTVPGTVSTPTDSTGIGTAVASGPPADSAYWNYVFSQSQRAADTTANQADTTANQAEATTNQAEATTNQTDTTANQSQTTPPNNNDPNDKKKTIFGKGWERVKKWNSQFKESYPKWHTTIKWGVPIIIGEEVARRGINSYINYQVNNRLDSIQQQKTQAEKDSVMKDIDTIRVKDYSTDSTSQDQGNMQMVPLDTSKIVDRGDLINYNE